MSGVRPSQHPPEGAVVQLVRIPACHAGGREFTDELRRQQDQVRQMFGRAIDPAALDTPESRRTLLDSLIAQRLVASAALRGNLTVTDETLRDTIRSIPAFQDGGQFSKSSYELVLRSQNPPMSPAQFE